MELISVLLLSGLVAGVPLGLTILSKRALHPLERRWIQAARWIQPAASLSACLSFVFMPGKLAASLTLPWLVLSGILGLSAIIRLLNGGWQFPGPACDTIALMYVPVGAVGLFASRLGINLGGFGEPIVLLTAIHFHFSGFFASIIAGEVVRRAPACRRAATWVTLGAVGATPMIAAGFILLPLLKLVGILFFSTTLTMLAIIQLKAARAVDSPWARCFLYASSLSIIGGMGLAMAYGVSDHFDWPLLSILQMAHSHGVMNGLGFAGCGLAGWFLIAKKETPYVETSAR